MGKKDVETLDTENMEEQTEGSVLKMALIVLLALILTIGISMTVLYWTNKEIKTSIDTTAKKLGLFQKQKKPPKPLDPRVRELAEHYLKMSETQAAEQLFSIKNEDKKLYAEIIASMSAQSLARTEKVNVKIREKEAKSNVLQREHETMLQERDENNKKDALHYKSLGIKGAIHEIEQRISETMDYKTMARIIENIQPSFAAKMFYYMDRTYIEAINRELNPQNRTMLAKELDRYEEFIRKNSSLSEVYSKMEPKMAAAELENTQKFDIEQLGLIFAQMDYLHNAKILRNFQNREFAVKVLEKMKEYEDYESIMEDSVAKVTADSLKVLQKYEEDVDILKKAYEKLPPADLADIIDKTMSSTAYKEYQIDETKSFRISDKEMTIEVLKRAKPTLVSALLSELKNSDRVNQAALLSREIGIPQP